MMTLNTSDNTALKSFSGFDQRPNHALQRTAPAVTLAAPPPSPAQPSRQPPPSLSLGSLGDCSRLPRMKTSFSSSVAETEAMGGRAPFARAGSDHVWPAAAFSPARGWSAVIGRGSAVGRAARRSGPRTVGRARAFPLVAVPVSPNHALQRTPGFGVQLPRAAVVRPAQSRAVRPAMKPGTARAFASRRRAHTHVPGPESLSLGSLGHLARRS
jgi:hypothetical protein